MAWFHNSLNDMEKAIKTENWNEVKRILQLHHRYLDGEVKEEVQHDLSEIGKDIMELKVQAARECAHKFEKTVQHLITEGKFLE